MRSAVDLCHSEAAARRQLGGVEFNDRLIGVQFIAFLCEDLLHATAHARPDMYFVYFDCPGNSVPTISATRDQDRESDYGDGAEILVDLGVHVGTRRYETGFQYLSQAIAPRISRVNLRPWRVILELHFR